MHVTTSIEVAKRLKKVIAVLSRKYTPEEFSTAIEDLKKLAEEMEVEYAEKPVSRKAWDSLWSNVIGDFIQGFEAVVVDSERDEDNEQYLRGVAKGMWAIYKMIEGLMVREK